MTGLDALLIFMLLTQSMVLYYPGVCLTSTSASRLVKGTDTAVMSNQILTRPFYAWVAGAFVHYIWIRERCEKINYLLRPLFIAISHPEEGWGGRILVPSRQNLPDPSIIDSQYYYDTPPPRHILCWRQLISLENHVSSPPPFTTRGCPLWIWWGWL